MGRGHNGLYVGAGLFEGPSVMFDPEWGEEFWRGSVSIAASPALALNNAQGELSPIERGLHALNSGMDGKAYAASLGRAQQTVARKIVAARVATAVPDIGYRASEAFSQLVELHAAPSCLWPARVAALLANDWTVVGQFAGLR
jgi:hypothetical protein